MVATEIGVIGVVEVVEVAVARDMNKKYH